MGDNIDLNISARIQTKEHCNRSLHWTHQFAVVDRASDPSLETFKKQKSLKDLQYIGFCLIQLSKLHLAVGCTCEPSCDKISATLQGVPEKCDFSHST